MLKLIKLCFTIILLSQLTACVTAVVGGAAAGGSMLADRRTGGIYVEDENIELKGTKKVFESLDEASHVNITSYNRIVLLTGEVPNAAAKAKAETLIKTIPNIRKIYNEIVIAEKATFSDRANDTLVTSNVKANFVKDKRFAANHVKVVTERSVVFLMGLVNQQEADAATEVAKTSEGVSKVVKLFEYLP